MNFNDSAAPRRVAITGYGALCSLGQNAQAIWDGIMDYQVGYRKYDFDDPSINARFFGFVDELSREAMRPFSKKISKMLPLFAKYSLVASHEALQMAFGDANLDDHYAPFQRGVILGTGWGGLDTANDNNNEYRDNGLATSFATVMSMCNAATAGITMNWNFRGVQNSPVAACATGTIAIGEAYEAIRHGRAKLMLAGGSESLKEQFNVWSIDVMQALSKEQDDTRKACCPFSKGRSGFVLSEGAAVLCLEDYESAKARGATILGEITGYANYSDAYDMTAPADDMQARVEVIREICRQAQVSAQQIDYVNLHGTSTPLNDINETNALKIALGDAAYAIPMSSTKSYTGHLIGAAGSLEAVFCLKAMASGTIPATLHMDEADPACDLNYTPNQHLFGQQLNNVMNLSFGFGGANAGVMIRKVA
ncbi:MAG: beta-ketoacyl-[acyl-carrier-protein] synthase family protein [Paucimonas sp.]|uniref:beta-ketoacyl-[acyl-carrier-protein] synthase family protein n=1 Tax=Pantoea sp. Cy-639 TaxID=2608360 RepID=UPI001421AA1A|nr:beta-ketoacyl-[acyl-carrier-protein] synthase family protein [Pantoea sp. Cy-639]MDR2307969.1 beta-ketoacyl-[acyl-carrier-protein] synthase family protein [Paucimonas sp.]NIF16594.1 beta-ketoacyl-[acyl-carrier-protein] synthase family protein [Pantoea sp. Cy-639]